MRGGRGRVIAARAVVDTAWRRITADPVGRRGLLLTGTAAALGCTLLATALAGARTGLTELIAHRVLGLSAIPLAWGDGRRVSASDVSDLLEYPEIAITCWRTASVVMPMGEIIPIRRVAGTAAGLARLGGEVREGRPLSGADTTGLALGAILGEGLARLRGRGARVVDDGPRTRAVGMLRAPQESPTSLALMTLLRSRDVPRACGSDATVELGIAGPLATVGARSARIARMIEGRRSTAARPPAPFRLVPVLPTALLRTLRDAERTTTTVLSSAFAVFAVAGAISIVILVVVRAEGQRADIAVSRAVGASRSTIVAELLVEVGMLGAAAGAAGALLAWSGLAVLLHQTSLGRPSAAIALATFAAVVATFGLAACGTAWDMTRQPPHELFGGERW